MEVDIGMSVTATDGAAGEIGDIVVDPVARTITHLVVEPHGHHDRARLVPLDAVVTTQPTVELTWSRADIDRAPRVERTEFISLDTDPRGGFPGTTSSASRVLAWPYYPLVAAGSASGHGYGYFPALGTDMSESSVRRLTTKIERLPDDTVEIRRSSEVVSHDDHVVGHVDGFVVDAGRITGVVLERGHLWGHRDITIPIDDVEFTTSDGVHLRVDRHAVGDYPTVPFHRHHREMTTSADPDDGTPQAPEVSAPGRRS